MSCLKSIGYCFAFFLAFVSESSASERWRNGFVINNYLISSVHFSVVADQGSVESGEGEIGPTSASSQITILDNNHFLNPEARGKITVWNTKNERCTVDYYHDSNLFRNLTLSSRNSLIFSHLICNGRELTAENVAFNNPNIQKTNLRLVDNFIVNIVDHFIATESPTSIAMADCGFSKPGSSTNCLNLIPKIDTPERQGGSSLRESLLLQENLAEEEPLSKTQFLGTHNSAVSPRYTQSQGMFNLNYADPDSYLSLTDQLDLGVRQLEIDILWDGGKLEICHNHARSMLNWILCDRNASLKNILQEIKDWLSKPENSEKILVLYLDVNLPLDGHVADLDRDFDVLENLMFTPAMAETLYGSAASLNELPADQLSLVALRKLKKNILVINDNDIENLAHSKSVFVRVKGSKATLPNLRGADSILGPTLQASLSDKYVQSQTTYGTDAGHHSLWRMNDNRTVIDYLEERPPTLEQSHFITGAFVKEALRYPVNILSLNMFGFSTNLDRTDLVDPRLWAFLWSWDQGYPLKQTGASLAFLDQESKRFQNRGDVTPDSALCYLKNDKQGSSRWSTVPVQIQLGIAPLSQLLSACALSSGVFAVPTTSYELDDVKEMLARQNVTGSVYVNLLRNPSGRWISNSGF